MTEMYVHPLSYCEINALLPSDTLYKRFQKDYQKNEEEIREIWTCILKEHDHFLVCSTFYLCL
jgi:hypothetical protein